MGKNLLQQFSCEADKYDVDKQLNDITNIEDLKRVELTSRWSLKLPIGVRSINIDRARHKYVNEVLPIHLNERYVNHAPSDVSLVSLDDPEFTETFLAPLLRLKNPKTNTDLYFTPMYESTFNFLYLLAKDNDGPYEKRDYSDRNLHILRELLLLARRSIAATGNVIHDYPIGVWYDHKKDLRLTFIYPNAWTVKSYRIDAGGYFVFDQKAELHDNVATFLRIHVDSFNRREEGNNRSVYETIEKVVQSCVDELREKKLDIKGCIECLDLYRSRVSDYYEEPLQSPPTTGDPLRGRSTVVESVLHLA